MAKSDDINPNNLLHMLYNIPVVGQKALRDLSLKDIYMVFSLNKKYNCFQSILEKQITGQ